MFPVGQLTRSPRKSVQVQGLHVLCARAMPDKVVDPVEFGCMRAL
jgi:hypothetical protein